MTNARAIPDQDSLRVLTLLPELLSQLVVRFPQDLRPAKGFSLFEQVWHLADVELEVYGVRIRRLLEEDHPLFPDYDGTGVAEARGYARRSVAEAIERFRAARLVNLALLKRVSAADWAREGEHETMGRLCLADLAHHIAAHDAEHGRELEALFAEHGVKASLSELRAIYESPLAIE